MSDTRSPLRGLESYFRSLPSRRIDLGVAGTPSRTAALARCRAAALRSSRSSAERPRGQIVPNDDWRQSRRITPRHSSPLEALARLPATQTFLECSSRELVALTASRSTVADNVDYTTVTHTVFPSPDVLYSHPPVDEIALATTPTGPTRLTPDSSHLSSRSGEGIWKLGASCSGASCIFPDASAAWVLKVSPFISSRGLPYGRLDGLSTTCCARGRRSRSFPRRASSHRDDAISSWRVVTPRGSSSYLSRTRGEKTIRIRRARQRIDFSTHAERKIPESIRSQLRARVQAVGRFSPQDRSAQPAADRGMERAHIRRLVCVCAALGKRHNSALRRSDRS